MSMTNWAAVDDYIEETLVQAPEVMAEILVANAESGLPAIDVSPAQGKFLQLLVRMIGARRILEIGTLGGYSTIWMARGMPKDGRIVTLEYEPRHADQARENFLRAGFSEQIDLHVGAAAETLPKLEQAGAGPFDLIFIDADKPNNPVYIECALRVSRPGTVIVLDNVVRGGAVVDADSVDLSVVGTRNAFEIISRHPRLDATAMQTVGAKDWDGFAIMTVTE